MAAGCGGDEVVVVVVAAAAVVFALFVVAEGNEDNDGWDELGEFKIGVVTARNAALGSYGAPYSLRYIAGSVPVCNQCRDREKRE